ncbi:MAG: caspase family protein, partial [Cyanobacteria bacterium J06641_5]
GFDEVILATDADLRAMETALSQFFTEIKRGGVGVFYYAGHGVQSNGENYLLPVDANIEIEQDIRLESLPLAKVLGRMEAAGNAANIIILDACRNDPFSRGWRSQTKGLASVDAAEGVLIAYATAPGEVAFDGEGRNGTFTEALLQNLRAPGQAVELMLKSVRRTVKDATDNRQIPWTASSLVGDFSFSPAPEATAADPILAPSPDDAIDPNWLSLAKKPTLESGPETDLEAMYRQLEAYLAAGDWLSADLQNAWLIAQVADRDRNYRAVSLEEITVFSCDDFQRIDRLWRQYSNDHFGYSVQLAAIAANGDTTTAVRTDDRAFRRLAIAAGWKTGTDRSGQGYRLYPGEHFFTLGAPAGHLPRRNVVQFQADGKWVGFQRAAECGL